MAGFKDEVEERIKDFTLKQITAFAWLCAVRALPFLSFNKLKIPFGYWNEEDKQNYLLAVIIATDYAANAYAAKVANTEDEIEKILFQDIQYIFFLRYNLNVSSHRQTYFAALNKAYLR